MEILFFLPLFLPFIAVATERSSAKCSQGRYIKWFLLLVLAHLIFAVTLGQWNYIGDAGQSLTVLLGIQIALLVAEWIFYKIVVQRVRDAGKSRLTAYLCAVPVLGLIWRVILMLSPSAGLSFDTTLTNCPKCKTSRYFLDEKCKHCGLDFTTLPS